MLKTFSPAGDIMERWLGLEGGSYIIDSVTDFIDKWTLEKDSH